MFRGNNNNNAVPPFFNSRFQYPADVSNQPQLCGNLPVEFNADPVNYLGTNHVAPLLQPNKCGIDTEAIPRPNLPFTFKRKFSHEETDQKGGILNHTNPVSTGLKLSYDDDERNSSITYASGSMKTASSVFQSLSNDIKREFDQQEEELNRFVRTEEENMLKGLRELKQRHMASFLTSLEKSFLTKLNEKNLELETITLKNKELVEKMKQVTTEAQNWCYMAKYNESVVNFLKTNIQQLTQGGLNQGKEGLGENDINDAVSSAGGSRRSSSVKNNMVCKSCKTKEVSVLLMPCRHLCLCKECEGLVSVCPVCQMMATATFEVFLS
ncbi:hypothetical protein ACJIZ3_005149 [Penstemon smallii]|uniref:RING-type domain-containing protein n=1 Tax=Penstemon smallii TaxID=265156 RepID=A0ABD3S417_9LAMI